MGHVLGAAAAAVLLAGRFEVRGADKFRPRRSLSSTGCGVGEVPQGYSQRYDQVFIYEEDGFDYGALHGYDSSDPRYRFPASYDERYSGLVPGGVATEICSADLTGDISCSVPAGGNWTHGEIGDSSNTRAKLYLASEHVAEQDLRYLECLNIKAFVDMTAPILHTEDSYPYLVPYPTFGRAGFTRYSQSFPEVPEADGISFPHLHWHTYYNATEVKIDEWLTSGKSVMVYDVEGSQGAAALAMNYMLSKNPSTFYDLYTALKEQRPWVEDLEEYPDWKSILRLPNG